MSMFVVVVLENGEVVPETVETADAKSLAWHFDDLNAMARRLGLRPLGDFEVDYEEQRMEVLDGEDLSDEDIEEAMSRVGDDGPWFEPDEGLRTVLGLIRHIEESPAGAANAPEVKLHVLRGLASEIGYAGRRHTRFHLAFEG
jgi:hypothetical protein